MFKSQEMLEVLEKYEKFLVAYSIRVLRSLTGAFREAELELLGFLKGESFNIPISMLLKNLEKAEDLDEAGDKVRRAFYDRHQIMSDLVQSMGEKIGKDSAHLPLIDLMEKGENYERAFAQMTLSCLGHGKAREELKNELPNFSRTLRWSILSLLERDGDQEWSHIYLSLLEDSEPEVARIAVTGLGKTGNVNASAAILPLIKKKHMGLVISAIQALGRLKNNSAVLPLLELAVGSSNDKIRATVISAVGEFPETGTIPLLAEYLVHKNPRVRANALIALKNKFLSSGKKDENILRKMKELLNDPDHRARADSMQCLWELGHMESLDYISAMLSDSNPSSRASAAYLCGKLKIIQLKDSIINLTGDTTWNVRKTAAIALLSFGEMGKTILEELMTNGNQDQQVCAAMAVSLSHDKKGIDRLFSLANSENELSDMATDLLLRVF